MTKETIECENYRKSDKNLCENFLGYKILYVDDNVFGKGEYKKEIVESCINRCALKQLKDGKENE